MSEEKKKLTLTQVCEIILKWVKSCDTHEQCEVLKDAIVGFWLNRPEFQTDTFSLDANRHLLLGSIEERKIHLASFVNTELSIPTLDRYKSNPTEAEKGPYKQGAFFTFSKRGTGS